LSDDDEKFHPNLDNNLNIRVNRITRDRKEEELDAEKKKAEEDGDHEKAAQVEQKRPLHAGNLCKVAEERTIINRSDGSRKDRSVKDGEEFSVDEYVEFKTDHKSLLLAFADADWETSRKMLVKDGGILLDDHANNFFLLGALDAEMQGEKEKVKRFGRQGQIISQIHQLAKPMKRPPRDLVHRFFDRFDSGDAQAAFQEGVDHFLKHIERRAIERKKEDAEAAAQEAQTQEEEEDVGEPVSLVEAMYQMTPDQRRGPGGLDPVEVFESLPQQLQDCFKSGDVEMLKKVASEMDPQEFETQFKRCIDAGLWKSA